MASITSEQANQLRDVLIASGYEQERRWEDFPLKKETKNGTITVYLQPLKSNRHKFSSVSVVYDLRTRFETFRECDLHMCNRFNLIKPTTDIGEAMLTNEFDEKVKKIDEMFVKFNEQLVALDKSGCEALLKGESNG